MVLSKPRRHRSRWGRAQSICAARTGISFSALKSIFITHHHADHNIGYELIGNSHAAIEYVGRAIAQHYVRSHFARAARFGTGGGTEQHQLGTLCILQRERCVYHWFLPGCLWPCLMSRDGIGYCNHRTIRFVLLLPALGGHSMGLSLCPLSGVKQTWAEHHAMSAAVKALLRISITAGGVPLGAETP